LVLLDQLTNGTKENKRNGRTGKLSKFVMKIKGIQKTTLIDYPGKIACTLFLFGCNFRCGFCHNPELVIREESENLNEKEILDFLEKRKGKLEGVCFTGGEPLLTLDKNFVKKIKEKNYFVKIDTNGSFPEKLKEFIEEKMVDYIAMDIKSSKEKYFETVGRNINLENIQKSIEIISNSEIDYEFRTTSIPGIHDEEEMEKIGKWIFELLKFKPKKYCLQGFVNNGKFNDEKFKKEKNFSKEKLEKLKKIAEKYFEKVEIRG
jgi:pyruvate formate lyase activating enzyme